jgi:hypothetical protein
LRGTLTQKNAHTNALQGSITFVLCPSRFNDIYFAERNTYGYYSHTNALQGSMIYYIWFILKPIFTFITIVIINIWYRIRI